MTKQARKNRRRSTILRDELIFSVYKDVIEELGEYSNLVPRGYIYDLVSERTGYCRRKICKVISES